MLRAAPWLHFTTRTARAPRGHNRGSRRRRGRPNRPRDAKEELSPVVEGGHVSVWRGSRRRCGVAATSRLPGRNTRTAAAGPKTQTGLEGLRAASRGQLPSDLDRGASRSRLRAASRGRLDLKPRPPPRPERALAAQRAGASFLKPLSIARPETEELPPTAGSGAWHSFDASQNAIIEAAFQQNQLRVRLPTMHSNPAGHREFEIRFGSAATSQRMPRPPDTGIVQVNTQNGNTRVVRRDAPCAVTSSVTRAFVRSSNFAADSALYVFRAGYVSDESRRRRGRGVDISWRRGAATPRLGRAFVEIMSRRRRGRWIFRGDGSRRRRGRGVDGPWRRVAATPRLPRGDFVETGRGDAAWNNIVETGRGDAAAATWIFTGDKNASAGTAGSSAARTRAGGAARGSGASTSSRRGRPVFCTTRKASTRARSSSAATRTRRCRPRAAPSR